MRDVKREEECKEARRQFAESLTLEERLAGLTPKQLLEGLTPEQILEGLTPEQILEGLTPEQILAGLAPEYLILTMPDDALRAISDDYVSSLPEDLQDRIRKRIDRPGK